MRVTSVFVVGVAGLAALATTAFGEPASDADASPLQLLHIDELAWLAPDADARAFLTQAPAECIANSNDLHTEQLSEVGRAAFRSPLLLGGQAARHGLSCNSCHRNGRDNPDFFLGGMSGDPGTADVTHSLFSKSREDRVANPVPIPTLLDVGHKSSFGTVAPATSLEAFMLNAITEEFQGEPPNDVVLAGLAAYIRRLDSAACPPEEATTLTLDAAIDDLTRTLTAASAMSDLTHIDTAGFLLLSAQRIAGDIHDRFAGPALAPQRAALTEFATGLGETRAALRETPDTAKQRLARSRAEVGPLAKILRAEQSQSFYDPAAIDAALELGH